MAASKCFRMEMWFLWVAASIAAGYLLAKHFEPFQPGGPKAINRTSTLFNATSGGQP